MILVGVVVSTALLSDPVWSFPVPEDAFLLATLVVAELLPALNTRLDLTLSAVNPGASLLTTIVLSVIVIVVVVIIVVIIVVVAVGVVAVLIRAEGN